MIFADELPIPDADRVNRFERLALDGAVTFAHRCMDAWLRQPCGAEQSAFRRAACDRIRAEHPLPKQG